MARTFGMVSGVVLLVIVGLVGVYWSRLVSAAPHDCPPPSGQPKCVLMTTARAHKRKQADCTNCTRVLVVAVQAHAYTSLSPFLSPEKVLLPRPKSKPEDVESQG